MEFQVIVFLIFGVIALIRALNQKAQQQGPQANAGQPERRDKVQSDIDAFLSEVSQSSGTKTRRRSAASKKRPQQARAQRQRQPQRRTQPQRERPARPAAIEQPAAARRPLGSGISDHVDTYISQHVFDHVDSKVDDHVEVDIVHSVESHLGNRAAEMPVAVAAAVGNETPPAVFRRLLKSRQGVRQAILLNEVLNRPRALRR